MPVLLRPDGTVQVGWDPRRAVLVRPPSGLTAGALAGLLRAMQSGVTLPDLQAAAQRAGAEDPAGIVDLATALVEAGVATTRGQAVTRSASVRIHGCGPLSDLLAGAVRSSGTRTGRSRLPHAGAPGDTDLVVLADALAADPRTLRTLHAGRMPHLPVRVRDGVGLVGPLVIPGVTSCLSCADLHRSDRDAAWPAVAAQLCGAVGTADRATVLGTAALALIQIDRVIAAVRSDAQGGIPEPPQTLDTTLEFDVRSGSITMRRWSRHPRCWC